MQTKETGRDSSFLGIEDERDDDSREVMTSEGRDLNKFRLKKFNDFGASIVNELFSELFKSSKIEKKPQIYQEQTEESFFDAIEKENYEEVARLLESNNNLIHITEIFSKCTPLHKAALFNTTPHICKLLIDNGGKELLEKEDIRGTTPIQKAVQQGNMKIVEFFIEMGADYHDRHLLQIATRKGNLRIIKYLIGLGVDINDTDEYRYTALHYAVEKNYLDVVLLLVALNAAIDIKNARGLCPSDMAMTSDILKAFTIFDNFPLVKHYVLQTAIDIEEIESVATSVGGEEEKQKLIEEIKKTKTEREKVMKEYLSCSEQSKKEIKDFKEMQEKWFKVFEKKDKLIERKENEIVDCENNVYKINLDIDRVEREIELTKKRHEDLKLALEKEEREKIGAVMEENSRKFANLKRTIQTHNQRYVDEHAEILTKLEEELSELKTKTEKSDGDDLYTESGLQKQIATQKEAAEALENTQKKYKQDILDLEAEIVEVENSKEKDRVLELLKDIESVGEEIKVHRALHKEENNQLEAVYEEQIKELQNNLKDLMKKEEE